MMDSFWHGLISRNFPHDIHYYFQTKPFCEVQIACCGPAPWHAVAGSEGWGTRVLLRWCCFSKWEIQKESAGIFWSLSTLDFGF